MKKLKARKVDIKKLNKRAKGILQMALWRADNAGCEKSVQLNSAAKALCNEYPENSMNEAFAHAKEAYAECEKNIGNLTNIKRFNKKMNTI